MKEYKEILELVMMTGMALAIILVLVGLSRLIYKDFKAVDGAETGQK